MDVVVSDEPAEVHGARCAIRGPNRPLRCRPGPRMAARPAGRGGASSPGRGLTGKGPNPESRGSRVAKRAMTAPTSGSRSHSAATSSRWDAMSSQVDGMPGAEDPGVERPVVEDSERPSGRHRGHRFPARTNRVKVMYADDELTVVREAAQEVGLRLSGYVAAAALAAAEGNAPPGGRGKDRAAAGRGDPAADRASAVRREPQPDRRPAQLRWDGAGLAAAGHRRRRARGGPGR